MTVPIATSPGRAGFGPQLALSYDSAAGNGPFGFGWSLSLPSIGRKTDKGLPRYRDGQDSDVFILAGAEDLVRVLDEDGNRHRDVELDPDYIVERYRPRVEGLFARIERWTERATDSTHWRVTTRDNTTSLYGTDPQSRLLDPTTTGSPDRVFRWLLRESFDDKGNVIIYEYVGEDDAGIDLVSGSESSRSRSANRYPKRILYGNRVSRLARADWRDAGWLFELVFDYNEDHWRELPWQPSDPPEMQRHRVKASATAGRAWSSRPDPFSRYRSGFEVRTHRRCHRTLMFHHFDELTEQTSGEPYLVKATEFNYRDLLVEPTTPIDDELEHQGSTRFASFIQSVRQIGLVHDPSFAVEPAGDARYVTYVAKSLPPLEFGYSKAKIGAEVRELDSTSLENLPRGIDNGAFRWVDLDGEGLSGILTEQADGWFYKSNLGDGRLGPLRPLPTRPSRSLGSGGRQLVDLAGDGQIDLVDFAGPAPGFFERSAEPGAEPGWDAFRSFEQIPNINWDQPNSRFVDLTGDGRADVLITENEVFTWYRSLGEDGFDGPEQTFQPETDEHGARLVLADGTQSIFLSDMSGDGLADIVRIRNGEVALWPSLGYGRFAAKVSMDNAPWFDRPDHFDHSRIRIADIDGSGTSDIIYLHADGVRIYFNQSGNRFSDVRPLTGLPIIDNLATVMTADLLGNGTACLVWSSPLPSDAASPLRYIDLMSGQKPHLMVRTVNNLGLETETTYVSSTKFYLADKQAGTPWITKLPFPVHCVERVVVADSWRKTRFASSYSYHHGYFDGQEREFRGFGRVEQVDSETYGEFAELNRESPYVTSDQTLYQPPIKTVSWFHTGLAIHRSSVLSHFNSEYFPNWFERDNPSETNVLGAFREKELPEPDFAGGDLSAEEWREALRACRGMVLRQETCELDVDELSEGHHRPVKIFSAANHNCNVRRLQPKAGNQHAVFLVTESEAISYHYELDLTGPTLEPDPRIAHTLNLRIDSLGNVLQSVAVVYPRVGNHEAPELSTETRALIADVQAESHLAYSEARFTNALDSTNVYRLPVGCEQLSYELTGVEPEPGAFYIDIDKLRQLRLSHVHQPDDPALSSVATLAYHLHPSGGLEKRLVEKGRVLFFAPDLRTPLPLAEQGALALPFESYKLALTDELLAAVYLPEQRLAAQASLRSQTESGYLSGAELAARFDDADGEYWVRSGTAGFAADAPSRFFLPEAFTDAFGETSWVRFDSAAYNIRLESSTDPLGNTITAHDFDFRVLAPRRLEDPNGNQSEVVFDVLGAPAAVAVLGKPSDATGDSIGAIRADLALSQPSPSVIRSLFEGVYDPARIGALLVDATSRSLYWFGETVDPATGEVRYGGAPAAACSITRETHVAKLGADAASRLQVGFEYSDGGGSVLAQKMAAEPAAESTALRWLTSGKTIVNNKGNPVLQYEPYFSSNEHRFEELTAVGVFSTTYYDAVGRAVRVESPDGTHARTEFSSWHARSFDACDTVLEDGNPWFAERAVLPTTDPKRRAADAATAHANTPSEIHLDSLGREVIAIAHNKYTDRRGAPHDERHVTFTKLDAEGKPLWIRDSRGNLVMQYVRPGKPTRAADEPDPGRIETMPSGSASCYSIAGQLLYQGSMDAGERWMLPDASGQPIFGWDSNTRVTDSAATVFENRTYRTHYDPLRRPLSRTLSIGAESWTIERLVYGESLGAAAATFNLRGQLREHHDPSGLVRNERFDRSGNLEQASRRLTSRTSAAVLDWSAGFSPGQLEAEPFSKATLYDALGRPTHLVNWHADSTRVSVYEPRYNQRGLLEGEDLYLGAAWISPGERVGGERVEAVSELRYDPKGQRTRVRYGNGTVTQHDYDSRSFRLLQIRTTRPGYRPPFPGYRSGLRDERVLQQLLYTYDAAGNIIEVRDEAYETIYFRNQEVKPVSRYTYDATYRLISATGRESGGPIGAPKPGPEGRAAETDFPITNKVLRNYTQHYTYDSAGNILEFAHTAHGNSAASWTRTYENAADSNRLLSTDDGSGPRSYDYDDRGSMLNLGRTPDEYFLRRDYRDMIRSANLGGGGDAFYNYDAQKQRTRKVIRDNAGNIRWERLYLGGAEIYRRYSGNDVVEEIETHHLFVGEERILLIDNILSTDDTELGRGILYRYQLGNHLGSVGAELDDSASIISYEEYHPYGTSAFRARGRAIRSTRKRYRYTGMERDEETGLSYHTARYYAPWLGRWMSADPIGLADGLNLYRYGSSTPLGRMDRSGKQSDAGVPLPGGVRFAPWEGPVDMDFTDRGPDGAGVDMDFTDTGPGGAGVDMDFTDRGPDGAGVDMDFTDTGTGEVDVDVTVRRRVLLIIIGGGISGDARREGASDSNDTSDQLLVDARRTARESDVDLTSFIIRPGLGDSSSVATARTAIENPEAQYDAVIVYGYSHGGDISLDLARATNREIDLLITVDAAYSILDNVPGVGVDRTVASSVRRQLNFFQRGRGWSNSSGVVGYLEVLQNPVPPELRGQSSDTSGNVLGSRGGPNVAVDPEWTQIENNDLTAPGVNHHNIDELAQERVNTRLRETILGAR